MAGARGRKHAGLATDIDEIDFVNASLGWANPVDISSQPANSVATPNTGPATFWQTNDAGATWRLVTPTFLRGSTMDTGVVQGTLDAVGGAPPGTPRPLPGSITLRGSDGTVFTAAAGSDGLFSVRVPIDTYTITGRSPLYDGGNVDCTASGPVTVSSRATIRVVIACSEK
jgi:hypothetical protein